MFAQLDHLHLFEVERCAIVDLDVCFVWSEVTCLVENVESVVGLV